MGDSGCQTLGTQAQPIQFLHCEDTEAPVWKELCSQTKLLWCHYWTQVFSHT